MKIMISFFIGILSSITATLILIQLQVVKFDFNPCNIPPNYPFILKSEDDMVKNRKWRSSFTGKVQT